jgi:hypothetical protein
MASLRRECKEPVRWGARRCPFCGETNPTGINRNGLWLWSIFVLVALIALWMTVEPFLDSLAKGLTMKSPVGG